MTDRVAVDFEDFLATARGHLEQHAADIEVPAAPPPPPPVSNRWRLVPAAAIVLCLVAGVAGATIASVQMTWRSQAEPAAAEHVAAPSEQGGELVPRSEFAPRGELKTSAAAPPSDEQTPSIPQVEASAQEQAVVDPSPTPPTPPATNAPKVRDESRQDMLTRLESEAHKLWRQGSRLKALARYETIVRLAGRTHRSELAYADMFLLARQLGRADRERKLRQRYVARFPRGRLADDVRGWQCRNAKRKQAACWTKYLADWPNGTYRREAGRVSKETPK